MRVLTLLIILFFTTWSLAQTSGTIRIEKSNNLCLSEIIWFNHDSLANFNATVTDTSGTPIGCAHIFLYREQNNMQTPIETEAYTDSSGRFTIKGVPSGIYGLTIGRMGYITGYFTSIRIMGKNNYENKYRLFPYITLSKRERRRLNRQRKKKINSN